MSQSFWCTIYNSLLGTHYRLDSVGHIKVADFGLSEDVYTTGYFRQDKEDTIKLPFKWMAPESLMDSIFNEKTDVVGKGVCKTTCMLKTITFDAVSLPSF